MIYKDCKHPCTFLKNAKIRLEEKRKRFEKIFKLLKTRNVCHLLAKVESVAEYILAEYFKSKN